MQGLESLDLENARVLSLFGVKPAADSPSKSDFYVMIVKGGKLPTSLILLDNELKLKLHDDFNDLRVTQVDEGMRNEGIIFALDRQHNLIKLDIEMLD